MNVAAPDVALCRVLLFTPGSRPDRFAKAAATALCGGEVETNTRVPEQWILDVERALFVELLKTEKTQQRIAHLLETGKPLRN